MSDFPWGANYCKHLVRKSRCTTTRETRTQRGSRRPALNSPPHDVIEGTTTRTHGDLGNVRTNVNLATLAPDERIDLHD